MSSSAAVKQCEVKHDYVLGCEVSVFG